MKIPYIYEATTVAAIAGAIGFLSYPVLSRKPLADFDGIAPGIERFDSNGNGRLDSGREIDDFIKSMCTDGIRKPTEKESAHLRAIALALEGSSHVNIENSGLNLSKALDEMQKNPHATDTEKISITK